MDLSIVTTARNEVGNVDPFLTGALSALDRLGIVGEVIYFDDASRDGTGDAVRAFAASHPEARIVLVRHGTRRGITAAIQESLGLATGKAVCYVPADLESRPEVDIPLLYRAMDASTDIVVGARRGRADGKLLASRIYNALNRLLFGVDLRDANWIKLIRRERMSGLRLRSEWHRLLVPILVHRGCTVKEVETEWHQRTYGQSHFGLKRFPKSLADIMAVKVALALGDRPLLGFLVAALASFGLAGVALITALTFMHSLLAWTAAWVVFGTFVVIGAIALGTGLAVELLRTAVEDTLQSPASDGQGRASRLFGPGVGSCEGERSTTGRPIV